MMLLKVVDEGGMGTRAELWGIKSLPRKRMREIRELVVMAQDPQAVV
jgi:hypothetical protein